MSDESVYLNELADTIGPRPATTDAEARAADWMAAVFAAKGLEVTRQEIDTPRSTAWGPFITYVLTIVAAVSATPLLPILMWPALLVALIAAVLLTLDLTGRWRLSSILPKGPSQNVIAKHVPHARRNERLRKVIIVANIDSARPNLITNGGLVRSQALIMRITLAVSWLVVACVVLALLPWTRDWEPWLWYVTMAVCVWLLFPIVVTFQELAASPSEGANTNASGVAALLGIVDRVVPDAAEARPTAAIAEPVRQGEDVVWAADLVPDEADLRYSGVKAPDRAPHAGLDEADAESWAEVAPAGDDSGYGGLDVENIPARRRGSFDTGTVPAVPSREHAPSFDDPMIDDAFSSGVVPRVQTGQQPAVPDSFAGQVDVPSRPIADVDVGSLVETPAAPVDEGRGTGKGGLGGLFKRKSKKEPDGEVTGWLGVDDGWDARKKGREIGSWDKFEEADDDNEIGWKGGEVPEDDYDRGGNYGPTGLPDAGGTGSLWESLDRLPTNKPDASHVDRPAPDPRAPAAPVAPRRPPVTASDVGTVGDPAGQAREGTLTSQLSQLPGTPDHEPSAFATEEIARIRRKVTQGVDRELSEKEIWFVATGAGEVDGAGMKQFLRDHGEELRDAYFIGLYSVGTGSLTYVTEEGGPVGKVRADRRLVTASKRIARDTDVPMKGGVSRWCETDIFVVRRRGHKAISFMAFDINGRLGEWRSAMDTIETVSADNLAKAADFVTALVREL